MSFEQNENTEINVDSREESTIFSDPAHYREEAAERKNTAKKSAVIKIVSVILAACVAVGGFFILRCVLPEPAEGEKEDTILIKNVSAASAEKISVKNETSEYTVLSSLVENEGESEFVWSVEGIDSTLTSSSSIENLAETVCALKAAVKVKDSSGDFGFDKPGVTVTVTAREDAFEDYTVTLGNSAPSGLGVYCKVSGDENVYVIDTSIMQEFLAEPIDFAVTTGFAGIEETSANTTCFSNGNITSFDYISISGEKYKNPLRIELQTDDSINSYFAYKITSPSARIGDDTAIGELVGCFSSGVTSVGAYSYTSSAEELKEYRLDNPDYTVTISLKGQKHTLKFSIIDDLYCAMLCDNSPMIHKVALSTLTITNYAVEDYYSDFIILETLSGLDGMKVETPNDGVFDFTLKYTAADEENDIKQSYQAFYNDSELDIENFKRYYSKLIALSPISHDSKQISEIAAKITLSHSDESLNDTVLTFKKYSSQRYQVELDGIPMGLITNSAFNELMNDTVKAANGDTVKE